MSNQLITLSIGAHDYDGTKDCPRCLFEAYNLIKHAVFTDDCPEGVSPVLYAFGVRLNDCLPDKTRQALTRYLPNGTDPLAGTEGDGKDGTRSYMALDWLIRVYLLRWLELVPALSVHADSVRRLRPVRDMEAAHEAGVIVRAAGAAAWDVAAWAAAWDAAWDAAGAAAGAAAWAAAGDAAGAAAGDAAGAAARDALQPTVVILQESALALYGQMVKGTWQ
jgi:hypothetical protein